MKALFIFGLLSLAAFSQVHAADDDWKDVKEEEVTLAAQSCGHYVINLGKSDVRVQIDIEEAGKCDPTTDLELTKELLFEGECFKTNKTEDGTECIDPGSEGLTEDNVCSNSEQYEKLDMVPFTPDEAGGDTETINGAICFGGDDYYLVYANTCRESIKVKLKVEKKGISGKNEEGCKNEESFKPSGLERAKSFAKKYLGWIIGGCIVVVAIIIVIAVVSAIYCACCCAPCKKKKETTTVTTEEQPGATQPLMTDDPKV